MPMHKARMALLTNLELIDENVAMRRFTDQQSYLGHRVCNPYGADDVRAKWPHMYKKRPHVLPHPINNRECHLLNHELAVPTSYIFALRLRMIKDVLGQRRQATHTRDDFIAAMGPIDSDIASLAYVIPWNHESFKKLTQARMDYRAIKGSRTEYWIAEENKFMETLRRDPGSRVLEVFPLALGHASQDKLDRQSWNAWRLECACNVWDSILNPAPNDQSGELPVCSYSDIDDDSAPSGAQTNPNDKDQSMNGQDGN